MINSRFSFLMTITLMMMCSMALADNPPGKLLYPSRNLDFEEGTIEFHYRFAKDIAAEFLPTGKNYLGIANFFSIRGADGGFSLGYFGGASMQPKAGHYVGSSSTAYNIRGGILSGKHVVPKGTWTHVAIVWAGNSIECRVNGKRTGGREFNKSVRYVYGSISDRPLAFGGQYSNKSAFVIDNLRVSKIARSSDELTLHPENRKADVYTTLWDTFETIEIQEDQPVASRPDVMAFGETAAIVSRNCKLAEGVEGRGLFIP